MTIAALAEAGRFSLDDPAAALAEGAVGPSIHDTIDAGVTVRQLLAHTSGVGDYLDEDEAGDIDDHVMTVPIHTLEQPSSYWPMLVQHPQREPPGTRFRYNNSGYMLLSIIIESLADDGFHTEVAKRAIEPAGMTDTEFVRSDSPRADTAIGYLADGRTNVHHLPVIGGGDGGVHTTALDLERFWTALFAGRLTAAALVEEMVTVHSPARSDMPGYGLGFWTTGTVVSLEGMDAGVSARTLCHRERALTATVLSNSSSGAWPLTRLIEQELFA